MCPNSRAGCGQSGCGQLGTHWEQIPRGGDEKQRQEGTGKGRGVTPLHPTGQGGAGSLGEAPRVTVGMCWALFQCSWQVSAPSRPSATSDGRSGKGTPGLNPGHAGAAARGRRRQRLGLCSGHWAKPGASTETSPAPSPTGQDGTGSGTLPVAGTDGRTGQGWLCPSLARSPCRSPGMPGVCSRAPLVPPPRWSHLVAREGAERESRRVLHPDKRWDIREGGKESFGKSLARPGLGSSSRGWRGRSLGRAQRSHDRFEHSRRAHPLGFHSKKSQLSAAALG